MNAIVKIPVQSPTQPALAGGSPADLPRRPDNDPVPGGGGAEERNVLPVRKNLRREAQLDS